MFERQVSRGQEGSNGFLDFGWGIVSIKSNSQTESGGTDIVSGELSVRRRLSQRLYMQDDYAHQLLTFLIPLQVLIPRNRAQRVQCGAQRSPISAS